MIGYAVAGDPFPCATIFMAASVCCPGGEGVRIFTIYYKALLKAVEGSCLSLGMHRTAEYDPPALSMTNTARATKNNNATLPDIIIQRTCPRMKAIMVMELPRAVASRLRLLCLCNNSVFVFFKDLVKVLGYIYLYKCIHMPCPSVRGTLIGWTKIWIDVFYRRSTDYIIACAMGVWTFFGRLNLYDDVLILQDTNELARRLIWY